MAKNEMFAEDTAKSLSVSIRRMLMMFSSKKIVMRFLEVLLFQLLIEYENRRCSISKPETFTLSELIHKVYKEQRLIAKQTDNSK